MYIRNFHDFRFFLIWVLISLGVIANIPGQKTDSNVWAQRQTQILTMNTGLQYEGELSAADKIQAGKSVFADHGTSQIDRIYDGLREIYVGRRRVNTVGFSERNEIEIPIFQNVNERPPAFPGIKRAGPFNEKGHREIVVPGSSGDSVYVQGITLISPRYCELGILNLASNEKTFRWTMRIGTNTLPTEVLRNVLRNEIQNPESPIDYIRIADFFLQAGRYADARAEIGFIKRKFPELEARMNEDLIQIRQFEAREVLREIRLRQDAGQRKTAFALAQTFNKENLANEILAEFAALESEFKNTENSLAELLEQISNISSQVVTAEPAMQESVEAFQTELNAELNDYNVSRLDAFVRLANDDLTSNEQKLALMISGWLLGSNFAIENLAVAQELFPLRTLVRKYLTTSDITSRKEILRQIEEFETGNVRQLTPLIQQMNPIDPPDLDNYNGSEPIEFKVSVDQPRAYQEFPPVEFTCQVHLPVGYSPYRRYPLLVTLPGWAQTLEQSLNIWCGSFSPRLNQRVGHASRNGFVVMAVDWRFPGQTDYRYSAIEHYVVLAALRQALRKFSIDSDRVYISGHGTGGDAAYDIGISHPEHWAGVIGVAGRFGPYAYRYRNNKNVNLPVLSIAGQRDSTVVANQDLWSHWVATIDYLDNTLIQYWGRSDDLFLEAVPDAFKWMIAHRRRWPDQSGFAIECRSLRPWDNYFWFLELDSQAFPTEKTLWPEDRNKTGVDSLNIRASFSSGNQFRINNGLPSMTIWLSPNYVDFNQEISVRHGYGRDFKSIVPPSAEVLLEDVRRRADRARPFWGKLTLISRQWMIN